MLLISSAAVTFSTCMGKDAGVSISKSEASSLVSSLLNKNAYQPRNGDSLNLISPFISLNKI
ncbi:hypothetical protein SAY87_020681 [Trapa incisa]|uniref:Uncharacterized protein n=1 Tax=Trapa incisa TaxID=236973 RepID=A0AAN7JW36_9MYRT|nr:hypothetical protein SAY87_020681 [Trapa incisa]